MSYEIEISRDTAEQIAAAVLKELAVDFPQLEMSVTCILSFILKPSEFEEYVNEIGRSREG